PFKILLTVSLILGFMCIGLMSCTSEYFKAISFIALHMNPNIRDTVNSILKGIENVKLIEPLSYPYLIWLMNKSYFVLTDSGGIQEEAPTLGKPVLVMRKVTERQEGVEAGTAKLVGSDFDNIVKECKLLLDNQIHYENMANAINPYGDGTTSLQILNFMKDNN
ncbi:MAG: UDP-N-acetylglucosamine 2-epimerase, partial [Fulvivirga sp.]